MEFLGVSLCFPPVTSRRTQGKHIMKTRNLIKALALSLFLAITGQAARPQETGCRSGSKQVAVRVVSNKGR